MGAMGNDELEAIDLSTLSDEELVEQMHDDLYDGMAAEILEGTKLLIGRGWGPERVLAEALERKLIVLSAGTYANVTRIIPPLVTTPAEVDLAISILDESITAAGA